MTSNDMFFLGNWQHSGEGGTGFAGATYGIYGIAPTLNTMNGGNRQPMILEISNDFENKECD